MNHCSVCYYVSTILQEWVSGQFERIPVLIFQRQSNLHVDNDDSLFWVNTVRLAQCRCGIATISWPPIVPPFLINYGSFSCFIIGRILFIACFLSCVFILYIWPHVLLFFIEKPSLHVFSSVLHRLTRRCFTIPQDPLEQSSRRARTSLI